MNMDIIKNQAKRIDRRILASAALVMVVLIGIGSVSFGRSGTQAQPVREEAAVAVSTITVQPRKVEAMVSAAGALSSRNTSVLSSKVMGRVVELNVNEGDRVGQGRVLVRIESGEIAAQAYQAQAAFNNAKLQYDRIKSLFDEQAATRMEMDQATLGLESARAGLNAARAMESYTTITAPISGQIVEKKINLGEMALPGQPILKIEDNRTLRLEATLKEQDIRFVHMGQLATVRVDALPDKELKGRVAQIVPASDIRTHSFIVKIDVPADGRLITGMYGKAFFSMGTREAIFVPRSAVAQMGGLSGVYLVGQNGNAVFQMVQLGDVQGDAVEAVVGLKAGDRMVVSRHDERIDGRKVVVAQN